MSTILTGIYKRELACFAGIEICLHRQPRNLPHTVFIVLALGEHCLLVQRKNTFLNNLFKIRLERWSVEGETHDTTTDKTGDWDGNDP